MIIVVLFSHTNNTTGMTETIFMVIIPAITINLTLIH